MLTIHERMIQEFGGGIGLRDPGLLESAVVMPSAAFGGQFLHDDLPAMTGAYLFPFCKNRPFVDGNKQVALATAITFLLVNDYELTCAKPDAEQLTLGVADGSISKDEAIVFFRKHVR
ncbi:MAG: Fic family protein [Planctomycetia bacterium]|nr:Fic family protein [Planctomycetia bacterium]